MSKEVTRLYVTIFLAVLSAVTAITLPNVVGGLILVGIFICWMFTAKIEGSKSWT